MFPPITRFPTCRRASPPQHLDKRSRPKQAGSGRCPRSSASWTGEKCLVHIYIYIFTHKDPCCYLLII